MHQLKAARLNKISFATCVKHKIDDPEMKYHTCPPKFKYACTKCSFHGLNFDELLTHVKESHFKCKSCEYISDTKDDLINHNQVIHKILKVVLGAKDRIEM